MPRTSPRSGKHRLEHDSMITVRLPQALHAAADQAAHDARMSVNRYVVRALLLPQVKRYLDAETLALLWREYGQ